jgi:uncharacterized protein (DUF488 family)
MAFELYTIGYEGASQQAVFQTLLYYNVQRLVDIRELPQSRKPGLSKTGLSVASANFGIKYVHLRALGTPRDIRYKRKIDHEQEAFRAAYSDYLAKQGETMEALLTMAGQERCCLMCFERDPAICHRSIVGRRAAELADGQIEVINLFVGDNDWQ